MSRTKFGEPQIWRSTGAPCVTSYQGWTGLVARADAAGELQLRRKQHVGCLGQGQFGIRRAHHCAYQFESRPLAPRQLRIDECGDPEREDAVDDERHFRSAVAVAKDRSCPDVRGTIRVRLAGAHLVHQLLYRGPPFQHRRRSAPVHQAGTPASIGNWRAARAFSTSRTSSETLRIVICTGMPPSILPASAQHYASARAQSRSLSTAMNASCGTSTEPSIFIRFLPAFWRSRSLRLRVMSPP